MVIVKLYGGLGNQMFQYAAGVSLASKLDSELYMDLNWFDAIKGNPAVTQRIYELKDFGINPKLIGWKEKAELKLKSPTNFQEDGLDFNKGFNKLKGNVVLDGYWQSYKYFDGSSQVVRNEFSFPRKISAKNKALLRKINGSNSVSLHVRRGDYNTQVGRKYHGLISTVYYERALKDLSKTNKNLRLFVFSDEIDWCKENLEIATKAQTEFVDSNSSNTGVEDMRLMSACKHNIIANSSFSWWAAWLNTNPKKQIYAPRQWIKAVKVDLKDRVPEGWRII